MVNKNSNIVLHTSSWRPYKQNMKMQLKLVEQRAMTTLRRCLPQFLVTFILFYEPVSRHTLLEMCLRIIFKLVINCNWAVLWRHEVSWLLKSRVCPEAASREWQEFWIMHRRNLHTSQRGNDNKSSADNDRNLIRILYLELQREELQTWPLPLFLRGIYAYPYCLYLKLLVN